MESDSAGFLVVSVRVPAVVEMTWAGAASLLERMRVAPMMASDLADMLAAPGNVGVAVGRKIVVDVFAVVRDGVQRASHGLRGGCRRVDSAYKHIHWDLEVLDLLFDAVGDRDSSWGVVHYSGRLGENRSGVVEYAIDDGMGHRWPRAETRWCVSGWSNWVDFASARGGHDVPLVVALRGVVYHHRHRRLLCYGH